jgi:hypothetical protein
MLVQTKHYPRAALDQAQFQHAMLVDRALQVCRHRTWAVFRVPGNANPDSTQVFDPIMATLGLNIDYAAGIQTCKIHAF